MQEPLDNEVDRLLKRAQRVRLEQFTQSRSARELREMSVETRLAARLQRLAGFSPGIGREAVLQASLEAAIAVFGADFGNIQRVVHRGMGLEIVAQHGFEAPFLNYFAYVRDSSTPCGIALRAGDLVCVQDVATSQLFQGTEALEKLLAAQVRAVSSMPLTSARGEVIGMLSIHYRSPREHSPSERLRMRALAKVVGRAIGG